MKKRNLLVIALLFVCLTGCSSKKDSSGANLSTVKSIIPDGAIHTTEKHFRPYPPATSFDHAVFWYQIATLHQGVEANKNLSGVVLKSCRIYCIDNNGNKIFEKIFDGNTKLGPEFGGLYNRNPKWFASDDHTPITAQQVIPGQGLVLNASYVPDKIVHWWSERFPYDKKCKYKLELKVKVFGNTALQIGSDYWKGESSPHNGWDAECNGTNNCESFVSGWYGDTKGEFITITREL